MYRFMDLTNWYTGDTVVVNPNNICYVSSNSDYTIIRFQDIHNTLWVKESVEEVRDKIWQAMN